jgi:hypothetical protein
VTGRIYLTQSGSIVVEIGEGADIERTEITAEKINFESATKAYEIGAHGIVYTRGSEQE